MNDSFNLSFFSPVSGSRYLYRISPCTPDLESLVEPFLSLTPPTICWLFLKGIVGSTLVKGPPKDSLRFVMIMKFGRCLSRRYDLCQTPYDICVRFSLFLPGCLRSSNPSSNLPSRKQVRVTKTPLHPTFI